MPALSHTLTEIIKFFPPGNNVAHSIREVLADERFRVRDYVHDALLVCHARARAPLSSLPTMEVLVFEDALLATTITSAEEDEGVRVKVVEWGHVA
jgi:uncharacterized protein YqiB (DUF1249 family)